MPKLNWPDTYHVGRWRTCLGEFIRELEESGVVGGILGRYQVKVDRTEDIPRTNFEFPPEFDQSTLPDRLQKGNKPTDPELLGSKE